MTPTKAISCPGGHYVNFLVPKLLSQSSSPVFMLLIIPFQHIFFKSNHFKNAIFTHHIFDEKENNTTVANTIQS